MKKKSNLQRLMEYAGNYRFLTYFATYVESGVRRITLAEKLRKIPLSFFGKKDLADLTSTIMAGWIGKSKQWKNAPLSRNLEQRYL